MELADGAGRIRQLQPSSVPFLLLSSSGSSDELAISSAR
jgi:hypothetical protein